MNEVGKVRLSQHFVIDKLVPYSLWFIFFMIVCLVLFMVILSSFEEQLVYLVLSLALLGYVLFLIYVDFIHHIGCKRHLFFDEQAIYSGDAFLVLLKDVIYVKRASWISFSKFYVIKFQAENNKIRKVYFYVVSDLSDIPDLFGMLEHMVTGSFLNENKTITKLKGLLAQNSGH